MLVCGFGYALRIWAYGFGFGRLVYTFGKTLRMQECVIVSGSCGFRENREKSREKSRSTIRQRKRAGRPGVGKVFVFHLVSRECLAGKERLPWGSVVPDGWI